MREKFQSATHNIQGLHVQRQSHHRDNMVFTSFLFPPLLPTNRKIIVCNHWKFMRFTHSPVVAVAVVEMSSDLQNRWAQTKKLQHQTHRIGARKKSKNKYHSEVELSTRGLKVENFDFKYEIKFQLSKALLFSANWKTHSLQCATNDTQNREFVVCLCVCLSRGAFCLATLSLGSFKYLFCFNVISWLNLI